MADLRHIARLKRGVSAWNRWRLEEPDVWPDLISASLRHRNLDGVNLENANLHRVDFEGASLAGAKLRNANLKDAILKGANLQGAILQEANLYAADLRGADLQDVDLKDANLLKGRFEGCRVGRSIIGGGTSFDSGLLVGAIGVDTIYHDEPWSVDLRTLRDTARVLTERPYLQQAVLQFYRNALVPENLVGDPFSTRIETPPWYTCFVSYSHDDGDFASVLCDRLGEKGVPYWRDADAVLGTGSDILAIMTRAIIAYDKVLLCCSTSSLNSSWVNEEIGLALDKEKKLQRNVLLPLDLDGFLRHQWKSPHSLLLSRRIVADFVGWRNDRSKFERSFEQVTSALKLA